MYMCVCVYVCICVRVCVQRYLNRYVEELGLTPTKAVLDMIRIMIPRSSLNIIALWASRGWRSDLIRVIPKKREITAEDIVISTPDSIFMDAVKKVNAISLVSSRMLSRIGFYFL